jgi:hypothetical protein
MSLPTIAPAVGGWCLVLVCGLLGTLAAARAAGPVDAALAVPPASRIPAAQLRPAERHRGGGEWMRSRPWTRRSFRAVDPSGG